MSFKSTKWEKQILSRDIGQQLQLAAMSLSLSPLPSPPFSSPFPSSPSLPLPSLPLLPMACRSSPARALTHPCCSSNQNHSSDNTWSFNHKATRELLYSILSKMEDNVFEELKTVWVNHKERQWGTNGSQSNWWMARVLISIFQGVLRSFWFFFSLLHMLSFHFCVCVCVCVFFERTFILVSDLQKWQSLGIVSMQPTLNLLSLNILKFFLL